MEAAHLEEIDENGEVKTDKSEYDEAWEKVKSADGIVVPGGFGTRYVQNILTVDKYSFRL